MSLLGIGTMLADRTALTPDRVAIEFGGRTVTYAELFRAASARAAGFAAVGCEPGDRVATLSRNCPEQVEVFFGCALAGLIMVPLNWRLTAAELGYQIADADPAVLLIEPGLRHLTAGRKTVDIGETPAVPGSGLPPFASGGGDPLMLLYTSGTSGKPKGALLTHANCFWTNLSLDRTAELTGDDVVLQVLPQCHVGGWNVQPLLAWWKGATVVLEQTFDAERVLKLIETRRITTMMGVPTTYLMLSQHPGFAAADLSSLRQVIVGGAPMPLQLIQTWMARGVTILQGYGLTEAAPNVLCVPAEYATAKAGSAGRPYMYVDVSLRPGTGELLVRGPNVFRGYWRDEAATAGSLRDGWLSTGDVAERDDDGFYWIRGRLSDMYISGGENVYPAEVEDVLAGHVAVAEAAVIGVPDQRWGETGMAFVVLHDGRAADPESLAAHCRERLAGFKVPAHVRFRAELPKLTSGKVDKVALRRDADR
jgi:fatty-acyl-CoA synthase